MSLPPISVWQPSWFGLDLPARCNRGEVLPLLDRRDIAAHMALLGLSPDDEEAAALLQACAWQYRAETARRAGQPILLSPEAALDPLSRHAWWRAVQAGRGPSLTARFEAFAQLAGTPFHAQIGFIFPGPAAQSLSLEATAVDQHGRVLASVAADGVSAGALTSLGDVILAAPAGPWVLHLEGVFEDGADLMNDYLFCGFGPRAHETPLQSLRTMPQATADCVLEDVAITPTQADWTLTIANSGPTPLLYVEFTGNLPVPENVVAWQVTDDYFVLLEGAVRRVQIRATASQGTLPPGLAPLCSAWNLMPRTPVA